MVFGPVKPAVNFTVAVTVIEFEVEVTETLDPGILHWLFASVPLLPGVSGSSPVPASSTRSNSFIGGW